MHEHCTARAGNARHCHVSGEYDFNVHSLLGRSLSSWEPLLFYRGGRPVFKSRQDVLLHTQAFSRCIKNSSRTCPCCCKSSSRQVIPKTTINVKDTVMKNSVSHVSCGRFFLQWTDVALDHSRHAGVRTRMSEKLGCFLQSSA